MADLFFLCSAGIGCHPLSFDRPTRLAASGAVVEDSAFAASIVPLSVTPVRFALVARADAGVAVGARCVGGVVELADRDRLFVDAREFLVSFDAIPVPVAALRGASCPVCDRTPTQTGTQRDALQRACPRCGARACESCWRGFRGGRCLTPLCGQPAALERELWCPARSDFLDFEDDCPVVPAAT
jgi:hypothetical protein